MCVPYETWVTGEIAESMSLESKALNVDAPLSPLSSGWTAHPKRGYGPANVKREGVGSARLHQSPRQMRGAGRPGSAACLRWPAVAHRGQLHLR